MLQTGVTLPAHQTVLWNHRSTIFPRSRKPGVRRSMINKDLSTGELLYLGFPLQLTAHVPHLLLTSYSFVTKVKLLVVYFRRGQHPGLLHEHSFATVATYAASPHTGKRSACHVTYKGALVTCRMWPHQGNNQHLPLVSRAPWVTRVDLRSCPGPNHEVWACFLLRHKAPAREPTQNSHAHCRPVPLIG